MSNGPSGDGTMAVDVMGAIPQIAASFTAMKSPAITAVMTAEPRTVQRSEPLSEAYHLLQRAPFHHLPVMDGDDPVGLISSTDILKLVYDIDGNDDRLLSVMLDHQFNIDDAMTEELETLPSSATVKDAAKVLREGKIHSVLVIGDNGMLEGIVTSTDLIQFLLDEL